MTTFNNYTFRKRCRLCSEEVYLAEPHFKKHLCHQCIHRYRMQKDFRSSSTLKTNLDRLREGDFRAKRGFYRGIVFRSRFEINVAQALDHLNIKWQYEPYRFIGIPYQPDFYLPDLHQWIECRLYENRKDINSFRGFVLDGLFPQNHQLYPNHVVSEDLIHSFVESFPIDSIHLLSASDYRSFFERNIRTKFCDYLQLTSDYSFHSRGELCQVPYLIRCPLCTASWHFTDASRCCKFCRTQSEEAYEIRLRGRVLFAVHPITSEEILVTDLRPTLSK